jgi:hypothetical protein
MHLSPSLCRCLSVMLVYETAKKLLHTIIPVISLVSPDAIDGDAASFRCGLLEIFFILLPRATKAELHIKQRKSSTKLQLRGLL